MTRRTLVFVVLCTVCIGATVGYAVVASVRSQAERAAALAVEVQAPEVLASIVAAPHLMYLAAPAGDQYRRVAVAPLVAPDQQSLTPLLCQRVYATYQGGLCLSGNVGAEGGYAFDADLHVRASFQASGIPSRVRLAADGVLGSTTLFVTGHSYADGAFSTATSLVNTLTGETLSNLEQFSVERDGVPFHAPDFNFWGVTFAPDKNRFYATLGTGGRTYLVLGDINARHLTVLREGVECPSLSPDGTRLAFKQHVPGSVSPRRWRIAVMDLATLEDRLVGSETRDVDDQIEWLDDQHVLYALPDEGPPATLASNVWVAAVDDDAVAPRILLRNATSPAVVR